MNKNDVIDKGETLLNTDCDCNESLAHSFSRYQEELAKWKKAEFEKEFEAIPDIDPNMISEDFSNMAWSLTDFYNNPENIGTNERMWLRELQELRESRQRKLRNKIVSFPVSHKFIFIAAALMVFLVVGTFDNWLSLPI